MHSVRWQAFIEQCSELSRRQLSQLVPRQKPRPRLPAAPLCPGLGGISTIGCICNHKLLKYTHCRTSCCASGTSRSTRGDSRSIMQHNAVAERGTQHGRRVHGVGTGTAERDAKQQFHVRGHTERGAHRVAEQSQHGLRHAGITARGQRQQEGLRIHAQIRRRRSWSGPARRVWCRGRRRDQPGRPDHPATNS